MWQEFLAPLIVVEFVSGDGTEERDRTEMTGKFWVYERVIRPAYYGIYEVNPGRIEMYHLWWMTASSPSRRTSAAIIRSLPWAWSWGSGRGAT